MLTRREKVPAFLVLLAGTAIVAGEMYTAIAGVGAVAADLAWRAIKRWRDPLRRELARLADLATPGPGNPTPQPFPTFVAVGDSAAFVEPVPALRNPLGSEASLEMWLDDGVHMHVVTLDGIAVDLDELGVDPKVDEETGEADLRLGDVDRLANTMPGDWAVTVSTPLWGATWERKAPGRWVCVAHNEGYA